MFATSVRLVEPKDSITVVGGRCRRNADHPVAIEILVEAVLQRFQRSAGSRHVADVREIFAVAVGGPDRIGVGARDLPGDLIAGCRLLRADRRPGAELAGRNGRTAKFQLGA